MKELLKTVETNVNSFCEEKSTLPDDLVDAVRMDLKEVIVYVLISL